MLPIDFLKLHLEDPEYIPEYSALIKGKSWSLKEPNQGVLDLYSTQIKAFEDMIIRLRRKYNAKLTIFRIPPEILSEIFLFCIGGRLTPKYRYAAGTFDFIYVCWYWKMVAYETPRLWSTWPGGCTDAWPILHIRSKNVPLDIHLRDFPVHSEGLEPIFTNFDTFRRLRSFDFEGYASWLEQFLKHFGVVLGRGNTSNLEELRLNAPLAGTTGHGTFERVSRFFSLSFPKLHTLEIINLAIDWETCFPSLSSIVDLTIQSPPNANRPNAEQLLSFLRRNPRLKELVLEGGALPQPDDTRGGKGCLELPDLRSLELRGDLVPTMRLLECLKLPVGLQHTSIAVNAVGLTNDEILSGITPFLRSYYLSESREERRIHGLRLSLDDSLETLLTIATTPKPLGPEVAASRTPFPPMNVRIQTYKDKRLLSMEVVQFLPLDNLRDLSLECLEFTAEQCKLMFDRVQGLEELCVSASSGPGAIEALRLPGLSGGDKRSGKRAKGKATETSVSSKKQKGKTKGWKVGGSGFGANAKQTVASTSQNGQDTIAADKVPLPKLKVLLVHEVVFGPRAGKKHKGLLKSGLVDLLRDRRKAGYGLEELGIQGCTGFGTGQVKACEEFVSNVVWDGDEGESLGHTCAHHHRYLDDEEFGGYWSPGDFDPHYQMYGYGLWDTYDSD